MKRLDENHSFNINVCQVLGGHIQKAILLKEIYGWCGVNLSKGKNIRVDLPWTYMAASAFAEKFPYMNAKSISKWLKELEEDGWIYSHNFNKSTYDRTKWYTVHFDRYDNAVLQKVVCIPTTEKWISRLEESISRLEESNPPNEEPIPSLNTPLNKSLNTKEGDFFKKDVEEHSLNNKPKEGNKEKVAPKRKKELNRNYPKSFTPNLIAACEDYFVYRDSIGEAFITQRGINNKISSWETQVREYGVQAVLESINKAMDKEWKETYIDKKYINASKNKSTDTLKREHPLFDKIMQLRMALKNLRIFNDKIKDLPPEDQVTKMQTILNNYKESKEHGN